MASYEVELMETRSGWVAEVGGHGHTGLMASYEVELMETLELLNFDNFPFTYGFL